VSHFRPEVRAAIRRWIEPAAALGLLVLALWSSLPGVFRGSVFAWFGLGVAVLALFWLRAAALGALAARPVSGAGMVVIREREIGYMGPHRGGFLELEDIARVEIYRVTEDQEPVWRLVGANGVSLAIPAGAEGAGHLPEALAALPGFSDLTAVGVLQRHRPGRHVVWERPAAAPPRLDRLN
jgi:hypothetical protein